MTKNEFLTKLQKSLNILEDKEVSDIISEYEGYIDEKVKEGKTEEEAVKELGDFNEIVNDLLAAYKVKSGPDNNNFSKIINKISNNIDIFLSSLSKKSTRDIIKILIELIIILFLTCLLKIPFYLLKDLGVSIFYELPYPIGHTFSALWSFLIELSYVITAIIFFVKMLEKRYFSNLTNEIVNKVELLEDEEEPIKTPKKSKKTKSKPQAEIKTEPVIIRENSSFMYAVGNITIAFLKVIVLFFLIGAICYLVGITIALGFGIYLLIKGVHYFGVLVLLFAMFNAGIFAIKLFIAFIFNKKNEAVSIFLELISIIVLTGIGLTMSTIEIANTEVIYNANLNNSKSITKEIPMTRDLELFNYDNIVIDNNLTNTVKIEYIYQDLYNTNIDIKLNNCGNGYCLNTRLTNTIWNKSILTKLIEDLKHKKIYLSNWHIQKIVYVSNENYQTILRNSQNNYNHFYDNE